MMFQGGHIDGSWELHILVTDINQERTIRVKGDVDYIGGLMFRLVESLDIAMDWSDHAFWWPERNMWLKHTRMTLDQCGVQADARLEFTPMHKNLKIQLPDLQILDLPVDCSINVFQSVIQVCKELGIRRPEELSIMRKLTKDDLKKNNNKPMGTVRKRHRQQEELNNINTHNNSMPSPSISMDFRSPMTPRSTPGLANSTSVQSSPFSNSMSSQHSLSFEGALESTLATSPQVGPKEGLAMLLKPKSYAEKARMNCAWLDSSRSLYEQEVREHDLILLRFKLLCFYDLSPKYDIVRINQIYEQAKWALMSEEIDCTEEEMIMFAALQLQIQTRAGTMDRYHEGTTADDDDIDRALNELQMSLEGGNINKGDITRIPELSDYIRYARVKKYFGLKSFKRGFFTFRDTNISMHRNQEEAPTTQSIFTVSLRGCEIHPDVNIANQKYGIRLLVQQEDGMSELLLRCETEHQYTQWMAACRLAAQGKTMADSTYESEIDSIRAFLSMQHPAQSPSIQPSQIDFRPEDMVAPRFLRKLKSKSLSQRILEAHANVQDMSVIDAKINFIKAWQALPEFGISYFIVKFNNVKKEELLGLAPNRLVRMDLSSGESLKTWRYSTMESWHVNWDVKQVRVQFEEEKVAFICLTADCKVVHEFIGGYIFCSMRSSEKNQTLNEDMFHKLTGGWD